MGYFVKIDSSTTKKYEMVGLDSFKNLLGFLNHMRFHKATYLGTDVVKETYFDTPEHLLNKSGVILSRFEEGNNVFFRVENTAFLSKILNKMGKEVFVHKVGANDKLSDHAFYVKDGITALYSTPFSIDLENVINNSVPKLQITTKAKIYGVASGTGMRVNVALEEKTIKNLETKRSHMVKGLTVRLESENIKLFLEEFSKFNELLQKNCKEYVELVENQFDFATKVTKKIVPVPKVKDKKGDKKKKAE